jgi:hypothetical protein
MGSGRNWGATEAGESSELQYKWRRGGRRFSLGSPLFKKYGLFLAKNKNKWALRWIGFCIGPVGCSCVVLEGLNTRGSPLETLSSSPAYCPFERKKETPPAYGYSSVTFFNLASTKLEDAVLDADTHTGRVARQSEVSNNRPTIYLLDCKGSQASQHSH